jgi:hypothetical protein
MDEGMKNGGKAGNTVTAGGKHPPAARQCRGSLHLPATCAGWKNGVESSCPAGTQGGGKEADGMKGSAHENTATECKISPASFANEYIAATMFLHFTRQSVILYT